MKHYDNEERNNLIHLFLGDLTPAQRTARALHPQDMVIPIITLIGIHLYGDPSQAFFVRGLGEKLQVEIDLRPFDRWIESDVAIGTVTVDGTAFSTAGNAAVIVESELYCQGKHIYDAERRRMEELYGQARRLVFQEYQVRFLLFFLLFLLASFADTLPNSIPTTTPLLLPLLPLLSTRSI